MDPLKYNKDPKYFSVDLKELVVNQFTTVIIYNDGTKKWDIANENTKKQIIFLPSISKMVRNSKSKTRKRQKCNICLTTKRSWINLEHNTQLKNSTSEKCSKNYFCIECALNWFYNCKKPTCPLCRSSVKIKNPSEDKY